MKQTTDTEYIDMYTINEENFWIAIEHISRYAFATWFCKKRRLGSVLDIACSNGYGTNMMAGSAKTIVGADIDDELIAYAKQHAIENTQFIKVDINHDELQNRFNPPVFDLIVCFETLEHIDNPEKMLADLKAMLHANGRILLSIPNSDYEPVDDAGNLKNKFHKHIFPPQIIDVLFNMAGFEIEQILGQSIINNLMRKHNTYCSRNKDMVGKTISNFKIDEDAIQYYVNMFGYPEKDDLDGSYAKIFILKHKK